MKNSIKNSGLRATMYSSVVLLFMLLNVSCKTGPLDKESPDKEKVMADSMDALMADTWSPWVAISNTTNQTLEIYNYNTTTWNSTTANWIFKPTTTLGFSSGALTAIEGGFGDQRLHYVTGFPSKASSAVAVQGGRWLGICAYIPLGSYVKGQKLWEKTYAAADDPNNHAIELLPNGNLAVAGYGGSAAGAGNWIRIYNTANPAVTNDYAQITLKGAHALLWDPAYNLLWAGGQVEVDGTNYHGVFAYTIGGTRENPTITEVVSKRSVKTWRNAANPNGFRYPHDLQPDYDNDDKMFYSDHTGVYEYNKITKVFTRAPGAAGLYVAPADNVTLKSAGKQADGKYVITKTDNLAPCQYTTNNVEFYDGTTGAFAFSRSVSACTIYRARVWTHPYQ
ncbi:DUF6528 family protein [Pedobacter heparinus]|uniref:DUF6528 family protein n=1 Tax=Pedobacter heparinus TaxID=984 RepID=UPI002931D53B|nr:DUF6528 family protein [Pedobacter heparinus]